jgi:hypothetical protein
MIEEPLPSASENSGRDAALLPSTSLTPRLSLGAMSEVDSAALSVSKVRAPVQKTKVTLPCKPRWEGLSRTVLYKWDAGRAMRHQSALVAKIPNFQ